MSSLTCKAAASIGCFWEAKLHWCKTFTSVMHQSVTHPCWDFPHTFRCEDFKSLTLQNLNLIWQWGVDDVCRKKTKHTTPNEKKKLENANQMLYICWLYFHYRQYNLRCFSRTSNVVPQRKDAGSQSVTGKCQQDIRDLPCHRPHFFFKNLDYFGKSASSTTTRSYICKCGWKPNSAEKKPYLHLL